MKDMFVVSNYIQNESSSVLQWKDCFSWSQTGIMFKSCLVFSRHVTLAKSFGLFGPQFPYL